MLRPWSGSNSGPSPTSFGTSTACHATAPDAGGRRVATLPSSSCTAWAVAKATDAGRGAGSAPTKGGGKLERRSLNGLIRGISVRNASCFMALSLPLRNPLIRKPDTVKAGLRQWPRAPMLPFRSTWGPCDQALLHQGRRCILTRTMAVDWWPVDIPCESITWSDT